VVYRTGMRRTPARWVRTARTMWARRSGVRTVSAVRRGLRVVPVICSRSGCAAQQPGQSPRLTPRLARARCCCRRFRLDDISTQQMHAFAQLHERCGHGLGLALHAEIDMAPRIDAAALGIADAWQAEHAHAWEI